MKMMVKCGTVPLVFFALVISLTGCMMHTNDEPPATQLQVREIQTRDFDTDNSKLVMKSMMNVLQDEGFIIKNAVVDLGLLSAEKNIDVENKSEMFMQIFLGGEHARWSKHQVLEASANVSEFGSKTRVRVNFQTKTIDNYGCPKNVETIKNPVYYQNFFEKVSKGLFLEEQAI